MLSSADIPLEKLQYTFKQKPLLVGGRAMEHYGLRTSGEDIDLVVSQDDIVGLIKLYPKRVKNLWGDLGVCPYEFEIWRTICLFDYDYYKIHAIEKDTYLVISLEKLLVMRALAMKEPKYRKDLELIIEYMLSVQGKKYKEVQGKNGALLEGITGVEYLKKTGPSE